MSYVTNFGTGSGAGSADFLGLLDTPSSYSSQGLKTLRVKAAEDGLEFFSPDTDDIAEGSTNLYYTNERVDDRVSSLLTAGTNITLTYDDNANTLTIDAAGGGSSDFLSLTDTPSSYTSQAYKLVQVNSGATALEFTNYPVLTGMGVLGPNNSNFLFRTGDLLGLNTIDVLGITGDGSGVATYVGIGNKDADGTDDCAFAVFGVGGPGNDDYENFEVAALSYNQATQSFSLAASASGTGTLRPLSIEAYGANQIFLDDAAAYVGINTDSPTAALTVNGSISTTGTLNTHTIPGGTGTLALTSDLHAAVTLGTANGLSLSTQELSLGEASGSTTGALTSTDWTTFNNKQDALTTGDITGTSNRLTVTGGTDAIIGSGVSLTVPDSAQLSVAKLTNLTSNGFVKTGSGDGTLSVDTSTYLTSVAFADLSDYPTDASGVLTNDGAGNLSWAAGGGGGTWGSITGTLSDQTDLQTALDGKISDTGDTITGNLTFSDVTEGIILTGATGTSKIYGRNAGTKHIGVDANAFYGDSAITYGALGNVSIDAYSASNSTISLTNSGAGIANVSIDGAITLSGTGGVFLIENATSFQAKNSGGSYETYLWPRYSDNKTYLNYGSAGLVVRNSSSTVELTMDNSGNSVFTGTIKGSSTIDAVTGYKINTAATSGTILRGNGTNYVASTATYPNTTTSTRVLYSTGTNTIGESANLTFNGSALTVTGTATATTSLTTPSIILSATTRFPWSFPLSVSTARFPIDVTAATIDSSGLQQKILFDASTTEYMDWQLVIPSWYNSSQTLQVVILWSAASATSGTCTWGVQLFCISSGDSADVDTSSFATATTAGTATAGTAGYPKSTTISIPTNRDSMAANDQCIVRIYRATGGITGDAEFLGATLEAY